MASTEFLFELSAVNLAIWSEAGVSVPVATELKHGRFRSLEEARAAALQVFPKPKYYGHGLRINEGRDEYTLVAVNAEDETTYLSGGFNSDESAQTACEQLFPESEWSKGCRAVKGKTTHAGWPETSGWPLQYLTDKEKEQLNSGGEIWQFLNA